MGGTFRIKTTNWVRSQNFGIYFGDSGFWISDYGFKF
jgi:hypothetical protein